MKLDRDPTTEMQCREALAASGWMPADVVWPLTLLEIVEVLQRVGFKIDADAVVSFANRGVVPLPDDGDWFAADLVGLASYLESRRDWQPVPSPHDPKKTVWQRRLEQARIDGKIEDVIAGFRKIDLKHALVMMTEFDSREAREQLFVTVQVLLEEQGITL